MSVMLQSLNNIRTLRAMAREFSIDVLEEMLEKFRVVTKERREEEEQQQDIGHDGLKAVDERRERRRHHRDEPFIQHVAEDHQAHADKQRHDEHDRV